MPAILTRAEDVFVSLKDRTAKANASGVTVFVSIHCNSAADERANGTEVYHSVGSRPGELLARAVHGPLIGATGLFDRGIKDARFYVLQHTKMPAILIELAFISNAKEEELLRTEEFQVKAAKAIAEGIVAYLSPS